MTKVIECSALPCCSVLGKFLKHENAGAVFEAVKRDHC